MGLYAMIFVLWMLSFKPTFSLVRSKLVHLKFKLKISLQILDFFLFKNTYFFETLISITSKYMMWKQILKENGRIQFWLETSILMFSHQHTYTYRIFNVISYFVFVPHFLLLTPLMNIFVVSTRCYKWYCNWNHSSFSYICRYVLNILLNKYILGSLVLWKPVKNIENPGLKLLLKYFLNSPKYFN